MEHDVSFGRWLLQRRKALDLTRDNLSQCVACSAATIRKIEAEERRPSKEIAERLAECLAIAPDERLAFLRFARGEPAQQLPTPPGRPDNPAPWRVRPRPLSNLPASLTPLIGREQEAAAVGSLLARPHVRLLTLTGTGGIGKTRLSMQIAADLLDAFTDGVWFVDLAPIGDPGLVAATIAHTLGVKQPGRQALVEHLKVYLREKCLLLVLDNFEQVVAAGPLLNDLLQAAARLKLLVTSRTPLHIAGEQEFPVPPLALPNPKHRSPLATLEQSAAAALFIQRAQGVKPDFTATDANAPTVAEICVRLDGLPLALELAAARVKVLAPQALLARLDHRLQLLTGGARDMPARHQTLRATIDWSYNLLHADEQRLFERLAVFTGGCTLEAAAAVGLADDTGSDMLDRLQLLVDQSLLQQAEGPMGEPRFRMLETIREYAWERLVASGEVEVLRQRHAEYFRQLAEAAEAKFRGVHQGEWMARLAAEQDNLRAALIWVVERREGETALRLAGALGYFWTASGQLSEGRQWIEAALATTQQAQAAVPDVGPASALRAKALQWAAWAAQLQGDFGAARLRFEEALTLNRARTDTQAIAWSLEMLAMVANQQGDFAASREWHAEAIALQRELGDPSILAAMLNNEGCRAYLAGDDARAVPLLEESLALHRQVGDTSPRLGLTLDSLGRVLSEHGDHARARALLTEALHFAQHYGSRSNLMWELEGFACLAAPEGMAQGKPVEGAQRAARLFGAAEALLEPSGELLPPAERSVHERHVAIARAQMDEAAWQAAWAEGRAMTLEQAVAYALEPAATLP